MTIGRSFLHLCSPEPPILFGRPPIPAHFGCSSKNNNIYCEPIADIAPPHVEARFCFLFCRRCQWLTTCTSSHSRRSSMYSTFPCGRVCLTQFYTNVWGISSTPWPTTYTTTPAQVCLCIKISAAVTFSYLKVFIVKLKFHFSFSFFLVFTLNCCFSWFCIFFSIFLIWVFSIFLVFDFFRFIWETQTSLFIPNDNQVGARSGEHQTRRVGLFLQRKHCFGKKQVCCPMACTVIDGMHSNHEMCSPSGHARVVDVVHDLCASQSKETSRLDSRPRVARRHRTFQNTSWRIWISSRWRR